jgi:hypothetical protein
MGEKVMTFGEIVAAENGKMAASKVDEPRRREGFTQREEVYLVKWYDQYAQDRRAFALFDDFPEIFKRKYDKMQRDVIRIQQKVVLMKKTSKWNEIRTMLDKYGLDQSVEIMNAGGIAVMTSVKKNLCEVCRAKEMCKHREIVTKAVAVVEVPEGIEIAVTRCKYQI